MAIKRHNTGTTALAGSHVVLLALLLPLGCGGRPSVVLRDAPPLDLPGVTVPEVNQVAGIDCNNPVHWDGETMYVFSSTAQPYRSSGPDLAGLARPSVATVFDNDANWKGGRWIESTCKDERTGLLYGWYHHEQVGICPQREKTVTAPQIGAAGGGGTGKQQLASGGTREDRSRRRRRTSPKGRPPVGAPAAPWWKGRGQARRKEPPSQSPAAA